MLKSKSILVVEDDLDFLWLIQKILKMNGFDVLSAVSAEQAIEVFSRNIFRIKVIILDLTLPDREGSYLYSEFNKVAPSIPIIITTFDESGMQRKELEKLGSKYNIIKPFGIMNLIDVLTGIV
jgi:DNA-binding response OmpR family regulator